MSIDIDIATKIEGLSTASEVCDYARVGFHQRHIAELKVLVDLANTFYKAGYVLEMLTCQDQREVTGKMLLVYGFNKLDAVDRHIVHMAIDPDTEEAPTISHVYGGANWNEREVYDMYGVRFRDHPNLQRILLPEDADFFALRKDFGRMDAAPKEEDSDD